jgi:hypothetical protein
LYPELAILEPGMVLGLDTSAVKKKRMTQEETIDEKSLQLFRVPLFHKHLHRLKMTRFRVPVVVLRVPLRIVVLVWLLEVLEVVIWISLGLEEQTTNVFP